MFIFSKHTITSTVVAVAGLAAGPALFGQVEPAVAYHPRVVQAWFSPNGGCTEAIVECINAAKKSVRIQAYSFTSAPIAAAVVDVRATRTELLTTNRH